MCDVSSVNSVQSAGILGSVGRSIIIDCDIKPSIPSGWAIDKHVKGGQFVFHPSKIKLHLSKNQRENKVVNGLKLLKEWENEPVLNANFLDFFLKYPHFYPESWKRDIKGKIIYVCFPGTRYCSSRGNLYIRCLYFAAGELYDYHYYLNSDWGGDRYVAVLRIRPKI